MKLILNQDSTNPCYHKHAFLNELKEQVPQPLGNIPNNFSKSLDILKAKHIELVSKLNELNDSEENIREKIGYLEHAAREKELQTVFFREIGRRKLITLHEKINNNLELKLWCDQVREYAR
ncbi:hypothetical protein [Metabacillus hrfriensis]|uniref:Uncharacterized protein n=1 Tax=Metabacillus hrfriensis TaxID=3048891 RepID=A0ACD4R6C8_9BACI|nr:hypothetical protein [Metabacillus sp. CT-WN-B3]WHZ56022.1 hypothetical protein QLQ22_15035 [Metabacillus sp. CT-WN-B3]